MPPATPRKLKSCLSSSSPSDCSSPADSLLTNTPTATATPPTPYSVGDSPAYYTTPTPAPRRQKKTVRFHPEAEVKEFRQIREIKETRTTRSSSSSTSSSTKRKFREEVKVEKTVEVKVTRKIERRGSEKKEEVLEVRKGKKRKESQDDYYDNEIMKAGTTGLGITVDSSYGPPTKAPPQAPLPRPTKRERTKYSQSPQSKSDEAKLTYSFDDSTSTSSFPNMSFIQAPPPPVLTPQSSFTEIANYPPVPQIMSTGFSFSEQPEQAWWSYQEPAPQPPVVAAASSRSLRRKRSFEPRNSCDSPLLDTASELTDVDTMRSRRGSAKSTSSSGSIAPEHAFKEAKVEKSSRTTSRRRHEEHWEEQFRMENLKRQARQKTRDREVKKHTRAADPYGSSFDHDAGAGYFNNKTPAYSFNANDGYESCF